MRKILEKFIVPIILILFFCVYYWWYKDMLNNSQRQQDIERIIKIEKILKEGKPKSINI